MPGTNGAVVHEDWNLEYTIVSILRANRPSRVIKINWGKYVQRNGTKAPSQLARTLTPNRIKALTTR